MENLKIYKIEKNGKIYGQTNELETAKSFARNLGKNAIIFTKRIAL